MAASALNFRLAGALAIALLLAACSGQPPRTDGSVPVEKQPEYTEPGSEPTPASPASPSRESSASAAYQPLLDKANRASAEGDYEQALALLERAQRIEPDSADIYVAMARTHRASGDVGQARAVAERGMLYCGGAQCEALRAFIP